MPHTFLRCQRIHDIFRSDSNDHLGEIITKRTIHLLNSEWPMSDVIRRNILEQSCDSLPCNLVLVNSVSNEVCGHARIIEVKSEDAIGLEAVVIDKSQRGKGLGKILMQHVEQFVKEYRDTHAIDRDLQYLCLNTHTAQRFYERCGFELCDAPVAFGNVTKALDSDALKRLSNLFGGGNNRGTGEECEQDSDKKGYRKQGEVWMRKKIL